MAQNKKLTILQRIVAKLKMIWAEVTFRPHVIHRVFRNQEILVSVKDTFGAGWYSLLHEPWPELDWIADYGIRPGDTVVDCGANQGFTSILFSKLAGDQGKIYAIEPVPFNVERINENLILNKVKNLVEVHNCAAGSRETEMEISNISNGSLLNTAGRVSKIRIPVRPLDDIVGDEKINFLKIDVEGFELEVLSGAKSLLKNRPRLDLELHVMFYSDKEAEIGRIFALIEPLSYEIYLQLEVDGPVEKYQGKSVDDLIRVVCASEIVHLFCL